LIPAIKTFSYSIGSSLKFSGLERMVRRATERKEQKGRYEIVDVKEKEKIKRERGYLT